jgi:hypothetical protein
MQLCNYFYLAVVTFTPLINLFKVYRMKNEVREPALSGVITNETKFVDQANGPSSSNKNAEQNKEVAERCREVKLQLERARRIL